MTVGHGELRPLAEAGATFSGLARFGIPVYANPNLKQGEIYFLNANALRLTTPAPALTPAPAKSLVVGVRPETEAEFAGRWARWHVRQLYDDAGVLAWLGEDLEPEPQPGDLKKAVARMTGWLL